MSGMKNQAMDVEAEREPLTEDEIKYFIDRHEEQVICRACKEWTSFGESCCGETECESECPLCLENQ